MTLILTLGNIDQIVQVSDRRLVSGGSLVEDESNKAGVFNCQNARLAFGYTGLAKYGRFDTLFWLAENLASLGPPDFQAGCILERLKSKATQDFNNRHDLAALLPQYKRLSVIFSGYLYNYSPPRMEYAVLTNYQDCVKERDASEARDSFELTFINEKTPRPENPVFIRAIGAWSAMREGDLTALTTLLTQRKPARAIVHKAAEVVRNIADRPQADGKIGKQLSTIVLPRDRDAIPIAEYHTAVPKTIMYYPAVVKSLPDVQIAVVNPEYEISNETGALPTVFPKVGRNKPCPCGSGKKYKKCHGSLPPSSFDLLP